MTISVTGPLQTPPSQPPSYQWGCGSFDQELNSCALLTTKTVKCWGDNHDGQLGDGTTAKSLVPVVVKSSEGW